MRKVTFFILIFCYIEVQCAQDRTKKYNPTQNIYPCDGSEDIKILYESNEPIKEEYQVFIDRTLTKNTKIILTLDSDSVVTLKDTSFARVYMTKKNTFEIRVFKLHNGIVFNVKGQVSKTVPRIKSLIVNNKENCRQPSLRYFDGGPWENNDYTQKVNEQSLETCGRRKVANTKFLQNATSTKPGDWPWHTAIYQHDNTEIKYICGGTLISNNYVLTAAQCTSFEGIPLVPETLSVFLGKFNLVGGDEGSQQRVVKRIYIHENFGYQNLDNDVSLLKLRSDVVFSDLIQPACLWYNKPIDKTPVGEVFGTLVGWGFDTTDSWSPHLQQVQLPIVTERTCLKSNPRVFSTVLTSNKFCAGYGLQKGKTGSVQEIGAPNCNGDSGSAFQIFIPDDVTDTSPFATGAWYVRGIVSLTVPRPDSPACDPQQYIVFTDVEKYKDWIDRHLKN